LNDTGKQNSIMVCEQKGAQVFEDEKECGYWMVYEQKGAQVSEDEKMWLLGD
jgi:hypothetical protein